MADELPDIAAVLAEVLQRVPRDQQPLLLAFAERLAADRYRIWAERVDDPEAQTGLRACAEREEKIADRIEALYSNAKSMQQDLIAANPDLLEINRTLFAPLTLKRQFALQAQGERLGAATWRSFAEHALGPEARDVFLGCAALEEESAEFLERLAK